jgi:hypothetical protein
LTKKKWMFEFFTLRRCGFQQHDVWIMHGNWDLKLAKIEVLLAFRLAEEYWRIHQRRQSSRGFQQNMEMLNMSNMLNTLKRAELKKCWTYGWVVFGSSNMGLEHPQFQQHGCSLVFLSCFGADSMIIFQDAYSKNKKCQGHICRNSSRSTLDA